MSEEKDGSSGFKVVDRRQFDAEGKPRDDEGKHEEAAKSTSASTDEETLGTTPSAAPIEADEPEGAPEESGGYHVGESASGALEFPQFIMGVAQLAFVFLGDLPNPQTGRRERNVAAAKQQIDLLVMLRDKTKGNLTDDEEKLIGTMLYELQVRFVEVVKEQGQPTR